MWGDDGTAWEAELARILASARAASGIDFSSYRASTMRRRAALRIGMTQCAGADDYLAKIESDPEEMLALVDALLIKTTWMYREPRTFDFLRARALPELFAQRALEGAQAIRAWVPACSSGEEAYTLAMCLDEARAKTKLEFQVIASDVHDGALTKARAAHYEEESYKALPPDFATRYLVRATNRQTPGAQVSEDLRSRVVIARHDALRSQHSSPREAGVSSFDIVSCRNLMVYLKPPAQDELIVRLLKTCMQDSLFVIGDSESVRPATQDANTATLVAIVPKIPVFRVA